MKVRATAHCGRGGDRFLRFAGGLAVPAIYVLCVRPRMLTWGAMPDEVLGPYPGDEMFPRPNGGATMATTIAAPPAQVWPWLAQMGGDRGGWYSWDRIDNNGRHSVDRLVPEWQDLHEGQRLKGPTNWFTVAIVEPGRTLVLHSSYRLTGRPFEPSDRMPWSYVDAIWGFHLRQTADGHCRLIVRTRGRNGPRWLTGPLAVLVWEPVHFVMQMRQFHNLSRRVRRDRFAG